MCCLSKNLLIFFSITVVMLTLIFIFIFSLSFQTSLSLSLCLCLCLCLSLSPTQTTLLSLTLTPSLSSLKSLHVDLGCLRLWQDGGGSMMTSMMVVDRGGSSNCGKGFGLLWVSNGGGFVVGSNVVVSLYQWWDGAFAVLVDCGVGLEVYLMGIIIIKWQELF